MGLSVYFSTKSWNLLGSSIFGTTFYGGANDLGTVFAIQVPEPSSIILTTLGLVGLLAWERRRRQR
jgi:uncharacterized repeat protein (TIGR03803 family)